MKSRRTYPTIESLKGTGQVYKSARELVEVSYSLNVQAVTPVDRVRKETTQWEEPKSVSGWITVLAGEVRDLWTRDRLTLHLEDARKIDFFVTRYNPIGGTVAIEPMGDFY